MSSKIVSTTVMISRLEGMISTRELNFDAETFVKRLVALRDRGVITDLTATDANRLHDLHEAHFG